MNKKVRLNNKDTSLILKLAKDYFNSKDVWIFGSRADLGKKGGDIDIFIKTKLKENILKSKIIFLRELEKKIGDQKVDLVIQSPMTRTKEIFKIAQKTGEKLC